MITTEMTPMDRKSELSSIYSDTYKDLYGFRPKHDRETWDSLTASDIEKMLNKLQKSIDSLLNEEDSNKRAIVSAMTKSKPWTFGEIAHQ